MRFAPSADAESRDRRLKLYQYGIEDCERKLARLRTQREALDAEIAETETTLAAAQEVARRLEAETFDDPSEEES